MNKRQAITSLYDEQFRNQAAIYFEGILIDGAPVDWRWFKAQAMAESNLDPRAVSRKGASGIMQIMMATAVELSERLGIPNDPFDPMLGIKMGVYYDRRCWLTFKAERGLERLRFMFGAYNAGAGNIIAAQRLADPTDQWWSVAKALPRVTGIGNARETIGYVKRIEAFYRHIVESDARLLADGAL